MKTQTRSEIARDMLRSFFDKDMKRRMCVSNDDFRKLRHNRNNVDQVKKSWLRAGIMKRVEKGYVLCRGYFARRDEVLRYVKFLRDGNPVHMKIGAQNLHRIYGATVVSEAKTFEDLLKTSNLEALAQGQEVVEVTHVDEVWKLFIDVLNDSQKFDRLLKYLTDAILNAVMRVKDNENIDLLNKQIDGRALSEALILSVRKAIFDTVCSETYFEKHQMQEQVAISLFLILRELDTQNEVLIKTIKELLSLPQKRTDFSKLDHPSAIEQTSGEQGIPDIWHVSGGYSDLFKVVYQMLESMGYESMKNLLIEWTTAKDISLSIWASIFYDYLLEGKPLKKVSKRVRVRVAIVEIIKPELTGMQPLDTTLLPASGWIGVKVINDSDIEYKGCLGKVKTDAEEFDLFDWEEYLRNLDTKRCADRVFNLLAHETKRLYSEVKTNTAQVSVTLDIGKETIKKELPLPISNSHNGKRD